MSKCTVLVIDDEDIMREGLARELRKCGCEVIQAPSLDEAYQLLEKIQCDIAICDIRLSGNQSGESFLESARVQFPLMKVVLISAAIDPNSRQRLLKKGASMCVQKPLFEKECLSVLAKVA